jgi:predicted nucleotidyltransferase
MGDLRDLLGAPVDVLESRSIHPYLHDRILNEAVAL